MASLSTAASKCPPSRRAVFWGIRPLNITASKWMHNNVDTMTMWKARIVREVIPPAWSHWALLVANNDGTRTLFELEIDLRTGKRLNRVRKALWVESPAWNSMSMGNTLLDDDHIMELAQEIIPEHGYGYSVWSNNCHHFCQRLTRCIREVTSLREVLYATHVLPYRYAFREAIRMYKECPEIRSQLEPGVEYNDSVGFYERRANRQDPDAPPSDTDDAGKQNLPSPPEIELGDGDCAGYYALYKWQQATRLKVELFTFLALNDPYAEATLPYLEEQNLANSTSEIPIEYMGRQLRGQTREAVDILLKDKVR